MKHFRLFQFFALFALMFNGISCSEQLEVNPDAALNRNEANIAALVCGEINQPEYMPLNVIPDWAKQKMTDGEYVKWQILSAYLKIDYSFLNDPNYAEMRNDINKRIDIICKEISEGIDLEKYSGTFSVVCSETLGIEGVASFSAVEALQRSEGEPVGKDQTFVTTIFQEKDVKLIYSLIYLRIQGIILKQNSNLYCLPGNASFSGSWSDRIDANGYVHVACAGHVSYQGVYHHVESANNYLLK